MNQKTRDGGDYSSYYLGLGSGVRVLFIRVQTEDSISGAGVQLRSLLCPLQGTLCRTILLLTVSFPGDILSWAPSCLEQHMQLGESGLRGREDGLCVRQTAELHPQWGLLSFSFLFVVSIGSD